MNVRINSGRFVLHLLRGSLHLKQAEPQLLIQDDGSETVLISLARLFFLLV